MEVVVENEILIVGICFLDMVEVEIRGNFINIREFNIWDLINEC